MVSECQQAVSSTSVLFVSQGSCTGVLLPSRGRRAASVDVWACCDSGERVLLASSAPSLQCPGRPTIKTYLAPNSQTAEGEEPRDFILTSACLLPSIISSGHLGSCLWRPEFKSQLSAPH